MSRFANPRLRLFIGAALISLSPVWVRLVDVTPTTSGFYRVFIGGIALSLYLLATRRRLVFSGRVWTVLAASAVFFALDLWFWHRSIVIIGPGLSTLLANFQVFFMMFAGFVLLKQTPRPMQIVAVPLALLGLGMIVGFDWSGLGDEYQLGIIYGLLTAVAYAGYMLTMRAARVGSRYRLPTREVAIVSLASALLLALSAFAEGDSLLVESGTDMAWLFAYGVFSHCLGLLFIASSLPHVSTTEAGIALLLQPTLSFIWDILFFARPMTLTELIGAVIVLSAIYLGSMSTGSKKS